MKTQKSRKQFLQLFLLIIFALCFFSCTKSINETVFISKLDIIDVTTEGSGIGKYEGMAVFVPQTAVGDKALVRVLKVKKTYAYGKLIEVLEPSACRIEPDCPVFAKCGGWFGR